MHLKVTGGGKRQRANCNLEEQTDLTAWGAGPGTPHRCWGEPQESPTYPRRGINLTTGGGRGAHTPPTPLNSSRSNRAAAGGGGSGKVREAVSCSSLGGELGTSGIPRCPAYGGQSKEEDFKASVLTESPSLSVGHLQQRALPGSSLLSSAWPSTHGVRSFKEANWWILTAFSTQALRVSSTLTQRSSCRSVCLSAWRGSRGRLVREGWSLMLRFLCSWRLGMEPHSRAESPRSLSVRLGQAKGQNGRDSGALVAALW